MSTVVHSPDKKDFKWRAGTSKDVKGGRHNGGGSESESLQTLSFAYFTK